MGTAAPETLGFDRAPLMRRLIERAEARFEEESVEYAAHVVNARYRFLCAAGFDWADALRLATTSGVDLDLAARLVEAGWPSDTAAALVS